MFFSTRLFAFLLLLTPSGPPDSLKVTVDLIDGSRILGTTEQHSFSFMTPYGTIQIPFTGVRVIEPKRDNESVKIIFENGDQLQGTWQLKALPLNTLIGRRSIPVSSISRISTGRSLGPRDAIFHYTFDDIQIGRVRDESGNGCDGIIHGEMPHAGQFSGRGVYVECAKTPIITGAFTVVASFVPTRWADPRGGGIISKKLSDESNGFVLYSDTYSPTKLNVRLRGDRGESTMMPSRSNVDVNVPQNWAVSYNALTQQVRIYKNGALDTSYANVDAGNLSDAAPVYVGHSQTWGGFFVGIMHDIVLFNRALSDEEVQQISVSAY